MALWSVVLSGVRVRVTFTIHAVATTATLPGVRFFPWVILLCFKFLRLTEVGGNELWQIGVVMEVIHLQELLLVV